MQGDWSLGLVAERLPPPAALPGQGLFTPGFGAGLACVASVPWLFLLGGGGEHTRARGEDLTPPSCEVLGLRHGHQLS